MQLIEGNCLEVMSGIQDNSIDMILADPPYGITTCRWDSIIPLESMWKQLERVIKPSGAIVMTASQPFTSALIMSNPELFKYGWVWEKSHPSGFVHAKRRVMRRHEDVCVFYKEQPTYNPQMTEGNKNHSKGKNVGKLMNAVSGPNLPQMPADDSTLKHPNSVLKINNPRIKGQHPTQKPVALMEYFIRTYTNEEELVLDFVMGSGTTGVACINTNRDFVGIELDKKYFNVASKRIGEAK